jgi:hypothetical protein
MVFGFFWTILYVNVSVMYLTCEFEKFIQKCLRLFFSFKFSCNIPRKKFNRRG